MIINNQPTNQPTNYLNLINIKVFLIICFISVENLSSIFNNIIYNN